MPDIKIAMEQFADIFLVQNDLGDHVAFFSKEELAKKGPAFAVDGRIIALACLSMETAKRFAEAAVRQAEAIAAKRIKELEDMLVAQRKAATDYCWERYKKRPPMDLNYPAVFTSHEWQKIGEAMDAAIKKEPENGKRET